MSSESTENSKLMTQNATGRSARRCQEERVKRFILAIILAGIAASSFPARPFLAQDQPGKLARLIQDGRRAAAFEMIRAGADVNEAQLDGTRPVHWAVYRVD